MFTIRNELHMFLAFLPSFKCTTQGHYSWSQGMGILGDEVQESQEFVTFLPMSRLFICKRGITYVIS